MFGEFPLFQLDCECLPALTNGPHSPEVPEQNRLWERGDWIVCVSVCVCLFVYILEEKPTV